MNSDFPTGGRVGYHAGVRRPTAVRMTTSPTSADHLPSDGHRHRQEMEQPTGATGHATPTPAASAPTDCSVDADVRGGRVSGEEAGEGAAPGGSESSRPHV